ncbi:MAG: Gfo/Idh/MocA family protein [Aggregatilineales bacterium]
MMRVALIGAGTMGTTHAEGWAHTDAQLVGVVATDRGRAESLAGQYGTTVYDSLDAILPNADVIDVCVPTHLHREFVERAAGAKKHVLCEKPIARTHADGEAMIAACNKAGVRLFIDMTTRFFPEYRSARNLVISGEIGKPAVVRLTRVAYKPQKTTDNWFVDYAKSGGPLLDLMIHDYDFARWIAGDVERVYARNVSASDPNAEGDYAQVLLRFRSGAIGHIEGGWVYPPPLFRRKIDIACEQGLIEWESDNSAPLVSHIKAEAGAAAEVGLPLSPLLEDPYTTAIKHFYDALTHDKPFDVTLADALAALDIALAAIESAQSGKPVTLPSNG